MDDSIVFFAGSSHPELAEEICAQLNIAQSEISLKAFPDGELSVEILEDVEGRDVFILQSLGVNPNHYLMELLIIIDALKRSSAKSITAIVPYLSYCRQDRRDRPGTPITAKLVANLLSSAGVDHLITCDLHSDQVEGFFEIPVTHLRCQKLLSDHVKKSIEENFIVVAPDIGSIKIAETMAKFLDVELAVIKKERFNSFDVEMTLIGDVANKNVLIPDDLCSTAGTLISAAKLCKEKGAKKTIATATHGLFVGNAIEKIESSNLISLIVANTIPSKIQSSKILSASIASM
ncbi:MAG: Ribose-phosphate pyrophosphokinase, partial [Chlamydiae bacterium]|nr:Ribose-phosphate pyrophosphokinase [Chlamydiota bacterium]